MLLSCKLIYVFLEWNFLSFLLNLRQINLLHDWFTIRIREYSESCTIIVLALPIASLTIGKGKTEYVTIFHGVWRKLLLQAFCIAIIGMFQSIHCSLISFHGLNILTQSILLRWSHIVSTLSHKLLHVLAILVCLHHNIHLCLIIAKSTLQSKFCSFCIIFDRLQSLLVPILIGILPHNKSIGSLAFVWIFVCKVCRVCCKLCITRSWYGVGTERVRSRSL